jgi:capsular exopolysaccharide synthesis family protein
VGLSDLLRGKIELEHAIVDSELSPNLQILTSGALPPDPSELVASEKMGKVLEVLKEKFDVILMDTPPMLVSDPQILASKADGVLYIIQPGKSHSRHFVAQLKQLDQINARILGVVFNRITRQHKSYYGGQPYGNYYAKGGQLYFEAETDNDVLEQN